MQLTWQQSHHPHQITSADAGGIIISEQRYNSSLLISNDQLLPNWSVTDHKQLDIQALEPLLKQPPEVLLIGTGTRQFFPGLSLLQALFKQGVGVEVMDTWAACRTFNILLDEERKVAAALIWE